MAENTSISEDDLEFVGDIDSTLPPCFGSKYSKKSEACTRCRAPVVLKNRIRLLKNVCQSICGDTSVANIRRLSSQDVKTLLTRHATPHSIFRLIAGDAPDEDDAREARKIMYRRFRYIEQKWDFPTPELPPLEELMEEGS